MSIKARLIALSFAIALATAPAASPAHAAEGLSDLPPNSAAAGIYGANHLETVGDSARLVYDYDMSGSIMETPFHGEVLVDFKRRTSAAQATFDVTITLFPDTRNQSVGPITSTSFNPLLLMFFQRDVNQMGRSTGGSSQYFRNVIRRAMAAPGRHQEAAVTIDWNGETIEAKRISFQPFLNDENSARMRSFAAKTYSVTLAAGVPGGIIEIGSETTEPDTGKVLLRETYRLRESTP